MSKISKLLLFTFFVAALSSCQTAPVKLTSVHEADPGDYLVVTDEQLFKDSAISPEQVGIAVYDLEDHSLKTASNPTRAFIPASVQKVATALMALDVLGPKYHFRTTLSYRGKIHEDTLDGDLYLQGSGDPFFTAADLMKLAEQLRDRGIRHVSGHFYYDESRLGRASSINPFPSFGEDSYNPGVSALSLDFNESYVEKSDTRIYPIPELPHHELETPRPGSFPVQDPGLYTAEMFSKFCGFYKIELPLAKPGITPAGVGRISSHESFDLVKLIEMNLEFSNNLMSELIFLTTARQLTGRNITASEAAPLLVDWLKRKIPATDWGGYTVENGSGLSPHGRVTPEQELAILRYADEKRFDGKSFLSLLPIGGWKGSLRKRFGDPHLAFNVWAKTGTMNYSSALAGYFFSHSKKKYAFAIFMTDPKGSIEPSLWTKNARDIQDKLLARWIELY